MCLECDTTSHIEGSELQSISAGLTAMTAVYVGVLLLSVVVAVPAAATANSLSPNLLPQDCGRRVVSLDQPRPLIVRAGNATALYGEFPWQARILVPQGRHLGHQCGGIIITRRHVLTAAHCLDRVKLASIEVRVGHLQFGNFDSAEQAFGVTGFYMHYQFGNGSAYANDIALLRLRVRRGVGIEFGPFVQPACLPEYFARYEPDTVCEVSGWADIGWRVHLGDTARGVGAPGDRQVLLNI